MYSNNTTMSDKIILTCELCEQADLAKCLRIVKDDFDFDPETDSSLESCVELSNIVNRTAILVLESLDTSSVISRIQLVSQCRRAEVYTGKHLEYFDTVTGDFLDSDGDDEGGMAMFRIEIRLKNPTSRVHLKLKSLPETCWVMGVFTSVQNSSLHRQPTTSHFDMSHVNQLLDSKQMSDSAVKFKGLFETFNRGPQMQQLLLQQPASAGSLLSLMSAAKGDGRNVLLPQLPTNSIASSVEPEAKSASKECHKCQSLAALESRLMERIDQMERKQDEKFHQLTQLILSLQKPKE